MLIPLYPIHTIPDVPSLLIIFSPPSPRTPSPISPPPLLFYVIFPFLVFSRRRKPFSVPGCPVGVRAALIVAVRHRPPTAYYLACLDPIFTITTPPPPGLPLIVHYSCSLFLPVPLLHRHERLETSMSSSQFANSPTPASKRAASPCRPAALPHCRTWHCGGCMAVAVPQTSTRPNLDSCGSSHPARPANTDSLQRTDCQPCSRAQHRQHSSI